MVMSRNDWFRNTDWNPQVEAQFFARLARARKKATYLRIQANTLATSNPSVALKLLDHYFTLDDPFQAAQAWVDQAHAFLALGEEQKAVDSFERALTREREFPLLLTQAAVELPYLIATTRRREQYARAMELSTLKRTWLFASQHFKRETSLALILADLGEAEAARAHADLALKCAGQRAPGMSHHPGLGLVGTRYESTLVMLRALIGS